MVRCERLQMAKEDLLALLCRDREKEIEYEKVRGIKREKISARNRRTNEQIQKEAKRLLMARDVVGFKKKSRRAPCKVQKCLTQKKKRCKNHKKDNCDQLLKDVESTHKISKTAHNQRNERLIQRRNSRLIRQEQEKIEEKRRQMEDSRAEMERDGIIREVSSRLIMRKKMEIGALREKLRLKKSSELTRIQKNLDLHQCPHQPKTESEEIKNSKFRSISHWIKHSLSKL